MQHAGNEKDDPQYLNYLLLRALLEICREAEVPEDVLETIMGVTDAHAYDVPVRLRREADVMGQAMANRILDAMAEILRSEEEDAWGDDGRDWDDGLVSLEQADANKVLWKTALASGQTVKIRYVSDTSGETIRTVKPTGIRGPYGEAYCFLRKDDRVFRFDRILAMEII